MSVSSSSYDIPTNNDYDGGNGDDDHGFQIYEEDEFDVATHINQCPAYAANLRQSALAIFGISSMDDWDHNNISNDNDDNEDHQEINEIYIEEAKSPRNKQFPQRGRTFSSSGNSATSTLDTPTSNFGAGCSKNGFTLLTMDETATSPTPSRKLSFEDEPLIARRRRSSWLMPYSDEQDYFFVEKCWAKLWTETIQKYFHAPIHAVLVAVATHAARYPRTYVVSIILLSLSLVAIGFNTNFYMELDEHILWTPESSRPIQHLKWIRDKSGYMEEPRPLIVNIHKQDGGNVLGKEGVSRVFQALQTVRSAPDYSSICTSQYTNEDICNTTSVATFWDESYEAFQQEISTDEQAIHRISKKYYPDGSFVDHSSIIGNAEFTPTVVVDEQDIYANREPGHILTFAQMYSILVLFPVGDHVFDFEEGLIDTLLELRGEWENDGSGFRLQVLAERSFQDEFNRAIINDIPLVPAIFLIITGFTCLVFIKKDRVKSRCMLGFGAVVSVLLSVMSGYGLLFLIGVPFTAITQILIFIMFGIGLDDAFILSGSFARTDPSKPIEWRIKETMNDAGLSVLLTTLTSSLAFGLGCTTTIPAIYWLCLYAFPTVLIDFVYQITFFIALLVLDEERVQAQRGDCCFMCSKYTFDLSDSDLEDGNSKSLLNSDVVVNNNNHHQLKKNDTFSTEPTMELGSSDDLGQSERFRPPTALLVPHVSLVDQVMEWFARQLLRPVVKVVVLFAFAGLFAFSAYRASKLEQKFSFTDVIPGDSYVKDFWHTYDLYTDRAEFKTEIYFRIVDQSDPYIQEQMTSYVDSLVGTNAIPTRPPYFWLWDFQDFIADPANEHLSKLLFEEQLSFFLANPAYKIHWNDIVLDENGAITTSRCRVFMSNVDLHNVDQNIYTLKEQRQVSESHPVNQGRKEWAFFVYGDVFNAWQLFAIMVQELVFTTVVGVASVSALALMLIPHWTAVLFVAPFLSVLYIDLLGVLQYAGFFINPVSYVSLVMSIGLLVDFIMHTLLRYYEAPYNNRADKLIDMLRTMGSSITMGALSTGLGVLPLAFSSSEIFRTTFTMFIGMVTLGLGHGLILLPVVLSMVGPTDTIASHTITANAVAGKKKKKDKRLNGGKSISGDMVMIEETETFSSDDRSCFF